MSVLIEAVALRAFSTSAEVSAEVLNLKHWPMLKIQLSAIQFYKLIMKNKDLWFFIVFGGKREQLLLYVSHQEMRLLLL